MNGRKLDFDHLTPIQLAAVGKNGSRRKVSEGSESRKHRHHHHHHGADDDSFRRRSVRSIDKAFKNFSSSSTSSDSEDDIEVQNLLGQSRNRLENTEALRIRRHLLRPEDYVRKMKNKFSFSRSNSGSSGRSEVGRVSPAPPTINREDIVDSVGVNKLNPSIEKSEFLDDTVVGCEADDVEFDGSGGTKFGLCVFVFVAFVILHKMYKMMRWHDVLG